MLNVVSCEGQNVDSVDIAWLGPGDPNFKKGLHMSIFFHTLNVLHCGIDELQISIMTQDANSLHLFNVLFNVLSCTRGRKRHFKHDSRCQVGSFVEHSVL